MRRSTSFSLRLFRQALLFPSIASVSSFGTNTIIHSSVNLVNKFNYRKSFVAKMAPLLDFDIPNDVEETDDAIKTVSKKRLVLVGGGHSHLQVIKSFNHAIRPEDLDVVVIDLTDRPCYSGMVPSVVGGIYSPSEAFLDLESLAEWADIQFVKDRVIDIDVDAKVAITQENRKLPFDAISIDIGSTSRGFLDIPGAKDYTISTRPISELIRRIEVETNILKQGNNYDGVSQASVVNLMVVGGGAAGVELALNLLGRWKPIVEEPNISVTILNSFDRIFPNETPVNQEAILQQLKERGIRVINDATVNRVDPHSLLLESGERLGFTHCVWATGAECHSTLVSSLREHGLAVSKNGWIRVNENFQSVSHPFLFAAGDCCTLELPGGGRSPPKAGVYAVRAGPVLIENLSQFLGQDVDTSYSVKNEVGDGYNEKGIGDSLSLKAYKPQSDFLKLLACGDGKALGFRFGIPFYGKWVFEMKDAIDRSFMDLFRRENLPELVRGQAYDISQFDASSNRPNPLPPVEAAMLLQRSDDGVDFRVAWNALRAMKEDDAYRDNVLGYIELDPSEEGKAVVWDSSSKGKTERRQATG